MILIAIILFLFCAGLLYVIVRAHRDHSDALTSIHADLAEGVSDLKKAMRRMDSKFDGGEKP